MSNQHIDLEKLQAEVTALKKASHPGKPSRLNKFYLIGFYVLLIALIGLGVYTVRLQRTALAQVSKFAEEKGKLTSDKEQQSKIIDDRNNVIAKYGTELADTKKAYWQLQADSKKSNSGQVNTSQPVYTLPTITPVTYTPPPSLTCNSTYNIFGGLTTTCR